MIALRKRLIPCGVGLLCVVALTGCAVVTDMINPDLLTSFGIDPQTVFRSEGSVIIAFKNSTAYPAPYMGVITTDSVYTDLETADLTDETVDLRDVYDLPAGETRTLVVDCPIYWIMPGTAFGSTGEGVEEVAYAGYPLVDGYEFQCGDVIEVELIQGTAALAQRVRVIPGR